MRVLAIGPHPDDIEIGCGGTLVKYAHKGHDLFLMVLTGGGCGGDPALRIREQEASARRLGARALVWGGYEDTQLPLAYNEVIQKIEGAIREVTPDFIFVNYFQDTHQDHRTLAEATLSATRYVRNVLFYEVPTTRDFNPSVFVDIEGVFDEKLRLLECHASQINRTMVEGLSIRDVAQSAAHFRGVQGRVRYAEAFVCLRLFINVFDGSDFPGAPVTP
ncbi:MAG: PIG-L family deacetylase [Deltaproteobacteria bacterium]|nr:PIG-L family deacetylase [Deltaproteobacteria bacterium]